MAELRVETLDNRTRFAPGETLEGVAGWEVDEADTATLRLFWRTEGKGTQDMGLAHEITFDNPSRTDARTFRIALPDGPHTYDGKLIAIAWALELVVKPGKHHHLVDVELRP